MKNNFWIDYWKGFVSSYVLDLNLFILFSVDRVMVCDQQFNYLDIFQLELGQLKHTHPAFNKNKTGSEFLLCFFRSDLASIGGKPWSRLKKELRNPSFNQADFMATLSTEEIIKLYELVVEDGLADLIDSLSFNCYEFKKLTQQYSLGFDGRAE